MGEEERKMERTKEGEKGRSQEALRLASEENRRVAENAVFCKIQRLKDECERRKVKPFFFIYKGCSVLNTERTLSNSITSFSFENNNFLPRILAHSVILPIQSIMCGFFLISLTAS